MPGCSELGIWVQEGIGKRQLSLTVSLEHLRGCHKIMTATGPWENSSLFGFAVTQSLVLTYLTSNPYSTSSLLHPHFHLLFLHLAVLVLYSFPSSPASSIFPSCFLQHENKTLMLFPTPVEAFSSFQAKVVNKASEMCSSSVVGLPRVSQAVEWLLFAPW